MNDNINSSKKELILFFNQFLKIIDLFDLINNLSFDFNSELFKDFEKYKFPNWEKYYPILGNYKNSPLFDLNIPENEFNLDFSDYEEFINQSSVIKRLKELGTKDKHTVKKGEDRLTKSQVDFILSTYAVMNFSLCAAIFGENPLELFKKAKSGDRKSILKVIQLDKSLIGSNWSMKEIKKAQLSGDQEYFDQLSKAIKTKPFTPKKKNIKLTLFLVFGWEMGLKELTNEEIFDLVKELGIYGSDDPGSLHREMNRLGLRKRGRKRKAN
ncbi:hypothetical protein [Nitrospina gracilis]|uniref:hypothetical protein n=1 Tax=Nitrospina gracilis TaxID=35801 RepID=UPI001F1CFDC1|nr:hypothetical protein [Nitrospina gracilis]MCF8721774.1 hypothetical protein [Nitrospina gracilis Nb-211]